MSSSTTTMTTEERGRMTVTPEERTMLEQARRYAKAHERTEKARVTLRECEAAEDTELRALHAMLPSLSAPGDPIERTLLE